MNATFKLLGVTFRKREWSADAKRTGSGTQHAEAWLEVVSHEDGADLTGIFETMRFADLIQLITHRFTAVPAEAVDYDTYGIVAKPLRDASGQVLNPRTPKPWIT